MKLAKVPAPRPRNQFTIANPMRSDHSREQVDAHFNYSSLRFDLCRSSAVHACRGPACLVFQRSHGHERIRCCCVGSFRCIRCFDRRLAPIRRTVQPPRWVTLSEALPRWRPIPSRDSSQKTNSQRLASSRIVLIRSEMRRTRMWRSTKAAHWDESP